MFSVHRNRGALCLITSGVNLVLLIKVVSAGFPHCKVIVFPSEISKYFREDKMRLHISCFSLNFYILILAITGRS